MINVSAVWLLALFLQAACSQTTNLNLPPEDQDSSGDDEDAFSGSGAGPLTDHPVVALNIPLEHANSSTMSTGATVHQPAVHGTENPAEKETVSSPTSDVVPDEAVLSDKDEIHKLRSAAEKPTTSEAILTRSPTTHSPTVRVTTAQASSTVHVTEPSIHSSSSSGVSKETLDPNFTTISEEDVHFPTTTILPRGVYPIDEKEIPFPEESSGDQGDFIFSEEGTIPSESELADSSRDAEAAGTSQGLMDRKEVLGGVIAGGLVGLLFAVFLVGFMLYRMKKKDEGSYSLDEPKQSNGGYQKPQKQEEFYA
ncbi:syndecan-1 [Gopherus evgoodei]|uniref:Syndecan n=1 Tax=Gopherus agassizii TaxID=38772 RepID=A0A452IKY1_9SAUR|nr:syndecan-1 [Gopherus evgoodei]